MNILAPHPPEVSKQRATVAALIGRCERIIWSGAVPEAEELRLRELIVETCNAFDMPTLCERAPEPMESHP